MRGRGGRSSSPAAASLLPCHRHPAAQVLQLLHELLFCCDTLVFGISALSSAVGLATTARRVYSPHSVDLHLAYRTHKVKLPKGRSSPWQASWGPGRRPWYQRGLDLRVKRHGREPATLLPDE